MTDQQEQKLASLKVGSHILAIYDNKKAKLDYAFQFLKAGLDNNEVVMIITDDLSKEEIRKRMKDEWHVDVDSLEDSKDIIIKSTKEWYYPDGKVNPNRISALWYALSELATIRKKKGVRVFGDVKSFFEHGHEGDLIRYEATLGKKFEIPVTALCAYESAIIREPEKNMITILHEHHGHIWH